MNKLMKTSYPLCEKFGFPITHDTIDYIKARQVEEFLAKGMVAFGCGDKKHGSLLFGPEIKQGDFEIKALVFNVEKVERTLESILAEKLQRALSKFHGKKVGEVSHDEIIEAVADALETK